MNVPQFGTPLQRQFRIVFVDGAWVDFAPPPDFKLPDFVASCRSIGYMVSNEVYIRWDLVRCVLAWNNGEPPMMPGVPQINAPTTETKQ